MRWLWIALPVSPIVAFLLFVALLLELFFLAGDR